MLFFINLFFLLVSSTTCVFISPKSSGTYLFHSPRLWKSIDDSNVTCPCSQLLSFPNNCILEMGVTKPEIILDNVAGYVTTLTITGEPITLKYTNFHVDTLYNGEVTFQSKDRTSLLYIHYSIATTTISTLSIDGLFYSDTIITTSNSLSSAFTFTSGFISNLYISHSILTLNGPLFLTGNVTQQVSSPPTNIKSILSKYQHYVGNSSEPSSIIIDTTINLRNNQLLCSSNKKVDIELFGVVLVFDITTKKKIIATNNVNIIGNLNLLGELKSEGCWNDVIPLIVSSDGAVLFEHDLIGIELSSDIPHRLQTNIHNLSIWVYTPTCSSYTYNERVMNITISCLVVFSFALVLILILTYISFIIVTKRIGKHYINLLEKQALDESNESEI
ncbi:Uncharacterized protein QTN25_002875 [Entamoeba marina]